ncbi:hypothetical protein ACFO25_17140 [Paenactinomyces guangxiensis]|uniref:Uncharacterized protein n=1 Tax=Paenactinomyces guangxiensis TaxID=1490290 RepID=A0A7W1WUH6_9BACL|nr:hypothetical protein [Paenactinomyces guangxiensis]MBA4496197.1 hypothetical protein [Paenactinomyces guangxiensis]MBH8593286.1 hypothetical protein [Paenactinomyces guangxiensis]
MSWKFGFILCLVLLQLVACQRFERPEERTGLDNDSHSFTNVGFPESKMKIAGMNVAGVKDIVIDYNGRNIMVYVIPKRQIDPAQYPRIAREVHRVIKREAPVNPFKVRVLSPEESISE